MHLEALKDFTSSGSLTLTVNGACMGDALPDSSEARIQAKRIYWPGDIVVFSRGDERLVSHRMLGYVPGRSGWLVMTRADGADHPDPVIPSSRILGALVAVNGRHVSPGTSWRLRSLARFLPGTVDWLRAKLLNRQAPGARDAGK